jgi:hypothetical protein
MWKWRPPTGSLLELADKGNLANILEPWNASSDSENMEFNNARFLKWYNHLIDTTQWLHIPWELLNLNTRNIGFGLNHQYTFVSSRHVKPKEFHTRLLKFYIEEEAFDKEFMSWNEIKRNPHKSGMHYLLPIELLKKKGQDEEAGLSSGTVDKKQKAQMSTYLEEEEEQPLQGKKRTLPLFLHLP